MESRKKGIWKIEGGDTEVSHMTSNHISLQDSHLTQPTAREAGKSPAEQLMVPGKQLLWRKGKMDLGIWLTICSTSQAVLPTYTTNMVSLVYSETSSSNPILLSCLVIIDFWQLYFLTFSFQFILYAFYTVLFSLCKTLYVWSLLLFICISKHILCFWKQSISCTSLHRQGLWVYYPK